MRPPVVPAPGSWRQCGHGFETSQGCQERKKERQQGTGDVALLMTFLSSMHESLVQSPALDKESVAVCAVILAPGFTLVYIVCFRSYKRLRLKGAGENARD